MEEVYVLKEINILDSGEKEFFVDVYHSLLAAENDLEMQILERISDYQARIEWRDGNEVKLVDQEKNIYLFDIQYKVIR
ncbi:hypothetical protein [Peribacillus kribbensis]|uniref:hypothetical protein n=1 Tax=Peribacillus kribbensis TaxID=356658 RepID=UPI00040223F6|nr:hypothetical protein [Peribacillus kribbensis]